MMLIPAHREVMNLVYYQDKSIEEVCRPDKHRQDANVLRVVNWRSCFAKRA
jgi:hypothetical protein